jgi:hypothetical protein
VLERDMVRLNATDPARPSEGYPVYRGFPYTGNFRLRIREDNSCCHVNQTTGIEHDIHPDAEYLRNVLNHVTGHNNLPEPDDPDTSLVEGIEQRSSYPWYPPDTEKESWRSTCDRCKTRHGPTILIPRCFTEHGEWNLNLCTCCASLRVLNVLTIPNTESGKLSASILKSITTFLGQAIRCTRNLKANQVVMHRFFFTKDILRICRFRCYDPEVNMAGEECIVSFITEEERQHICRLTRAMVKTGGVMANHFNDQVDLFFGGTKNPELLPTEFLLQFLSGQRAASIIEGYADLPFDSYKLSRKALSRVLDRIGGSPYFVPNHLPSTGRPHKRSTSNPQLGTSYHLHTRCRARSSSKTARTKTTPTERCNK